MPVLSDEIAEQVKNELAELAGPVRLLTFVQETDCPFCEETRQLVEELAQLLDGVSAEVYDLAVDEEKARKLGVDQAPVIIVMGTEDHGVRFDGIPSGYEFVSLLHAIKAVAAGEAELERETMEMLAEVDQPVDIQVFVTPTCPYCQVSVMLAHRLAVASPRVRARMVEAMEFPHLAQRYQVQGVPRTVINETTHIEGAVPERVVVSKIREALADGRGT